MKRQLHKSLILLIVASIYSVIISQPTAGMPQYPGYFKLSQGRYLFKGKVPEGFEDFVAINIHSVGKKVNNSQMVRGNLGADVGGGGRRNNDNLPQFTYYKFVQAKLIGDKFTFSTQTVKGISYSFEGTIQRVSWERVYTNQDIVIEGLLTMYKQGEKSASSNVKLSYEESYE
jgi:hypothetical protein